MIGTFYFGIPNSVLALTKKNPAFGAGIECVGGTGFKHEASSLLLEIKIIKMKKHNKLKENVFGNRSKILLPLH